MANFLNTEQRFCFLKLTAVVNPYLAPGQQYVDLFKHTNDALGHGFRDTQEGYETLARVLMDIYFRYLQDNARAMFVLSMLTQEDADREMIDRMNELFFKMSLFQAEKFLVEAIEPHVLAFNKLLRYIVRDVMKHNKDVIHFRTFISTESVQS